MTKHVEEKPLFKIVETTYDMKYLESVVECLEFDFKDLDTWSVYNDDALNDIVISLKDILFELNEYKNKIKEKTDPATT